MTKKFDPKKWRDQVNIVEIGEMEIYCQTFGGDKFYLWHELGYWLKRIKEIRKQEGRKWQEKIDELEAHHKRQVEDLLVCGWEGRIEKLENFVKGNTHDLGELGEFIRIEYVANGIESFLKLTKKP